MHTTISLMDKSMMQAAQYRVEMVRENLENCPNHPLPPGYSVRWYNEHDEHVWRFIHLEADKYTDATLDFFRRQFGHDDELLARRQCYLLDKDGRPIGTCTAWFDENWRGRGPYGRVHWMAIVPAYQGRGLSKPLLSIVMQRLRELGHTRAFLRTSPVRLPAISLYLKFGFQPVVENDADAKLWDDIMASLSRK